MDSGNVIGRGESLDMLFYCCGRGCGWTCVKGKWIDSSEERAGEVELKGNRSSSGIMWSRKGTAARYEKSPA
jgi:hypothetical protein